MASITTHVLDIALGVPARGLALRLSKNQIALAEGLTLESGRSPVNFFTRPSLELGTYELRFDVASYSTGTQTKSFYPEIVIHFDIQDSGQDYHVPLLLSHFGYSTYRGC